MNAIAGARAVLFWFVLLAGSGCLRQHPARFSFPHDLPASPLLQFSSDLPSIIASLLRSLPGGEFSRDLTGAEAQGLLLRWRRREATGYGIDTPSISSPEQVSVQRGWRGAWDPRRWGTVEAVAEGKEGRWGEKWDVC